MTNATGQRNQASRALVWALFLVGFAPAARAEGLKIIVSYTWVYTEVWPRQQVHRDSHQYAYTLLPNRELVQSLPGKFFLPTTTYRLGESRHMPIAGQSRDIVWHVENGDLVRRLEFPSFEIEELIATDRRSACRFDRFAKLRAGYKFFEEKRLSNHEDMRSSEMHAEDTACQILSQ